MSKNEGKKLQKYLKSNNVNIEKFALDMGYEKRQGLYYKFKQDELDSKFKEKAALALGVALADIFTDVKKEAPDKEKELLQKIIDLYEQLHTGNYSLKIKSTHVA